MSVSPEQQTGIIAEVLRYGWLSLVALGTYIFKGVSAKVDANSKALAKHIEEDKKAHENFSEKFVHKEDWLEFKNSMHSRFDKLEENDNKIYDKVINGVDRAEFKQEIGTLYGKVDSLERRKSDKPN